jgi:guanylate kinase
LSAAREELLAVREFDYAIVNDNLERAVQAVATILAAERRRISRISALPAFVKSLVAEVDEQLARG